MKEMIENVVQILVYRTQASAYLRYLKDPLIDGDYPENNFLDLYSISS